MRLQVILEVELEVDPEVMKANGNLLSDREIANELYVGWSNHSVIDDAVEMTKHEVKSVVRLRPKLGKKD